MKVEFTASPYATVDGSIDIPESDLEEYRKDKTRYILNHLDNAQLSEAILDYAGTDLEIDDNDDESEGSL